jgi:TolB-like protein/DNA-binding winged helix-turn-helix (wHTH) protein
MSRGASGGVVTFSGFVLDRVRRRLTDPEGDEIALTPKVFDTLACLAAHAGEVVEKHAIVEAVWPDVIVEDNNLNQAISTLRRVLGDCREAPRFIATVPRRGYRFVAPVRALEAGELEERERAAPVREERRERGRSAAIGAALSRSALGRVLSRRPAALALLAAGLVVLVGVASTLALRNPSRSPAAELSIAVLPFASFSADPEQEHFADGLGEELINRLAQFDGLRVTGRTSSFVYKNHDGDLRDIGAALGVGHLIEGSVRKGDGRLRVTAQLIDAASGFNLWSETYDRPEGETLAVQDDIARAVARTLSVTLGAADAGDPFYGMGPSSPEAYDLYLRATGRGVEIGRANTLRAEALLREAVALDPEFLWAKWVLTWAIYGATAFDPTRVAEAWPERRAILEQLAADAPQPWFRHYVRFFLLSEPLEGPPDWLAVEASLAEARKGGPPAMMGELDYRTGIVRSAVGRVSEALPYVRASLRDDPLSLTRSRELQSLLFYVGRREEAEAEAERSRDLPAERSFQEAYALNRALAEGDPALVEERLAAYLATDIPRPGDRELAAVRHDPEAALAVLRRQTGDDPRDVPTGLSTMWAAYYGDLDLAVERAGKFVEQLGVGAANLLWHPGLAEARRTAAFEDLVRDLGLLDYWRATGEWGDFCRPLATKDFECL